MPEFTPLPTEYFIASSTQEKERILLKAREDNNPTLKGLTKKRRKRIAGVEVRGNGPRALLAATILQAVSDLRTEGQLREEAEEFLLSTGCEYCLHLLEIPYEPFLEALQFRKLQCGTSNRAFWEPSTEPVFTKGSPQRERQKQISEPPKELSLPDYL